MREHRVFGLDIIRILAVFFVISVHCFAYQKYYSFPLDTFGKFLLTFFRNLFYICVPLFLLLTGYLNGKAKINKQYFLKIIKVLFSWFIIALICICYSIFILHEDIDLMKRSISVFNFTADSYGWYVEMYIGLFLLIPFLNILYDNLKDKKNLIRVMLIVTALPPLFSGLVINDVTFDILPDYWTAIYPITYYFLGRYLKDNPLLISNLKKFLLVIILLLIQTGFMYLYVNKGAFDWNFMGGYGNLLTVLISVLFFSLFVDVKCNHLSVCKILGKIASVTFEIYLCSRIFDLIFYKVLYNNEAYSFMNFWVNYLKIVPLVFICSFGCALFIDFISSKIYLFIRKKVNEKAI